MTVRDVRLSTAIERGVQGGPRFKTTVQTLVSGKELRNIDWQTTRGEWDASYGVQVMTQFEEVVNLFYTSQGRAFGFRFRDWHDYKVGVTETDTWQSIGTGDAAKVAFQAYKRYTFGAVNYDRNLTRLVSGTVRVFLDDVEKADPADYTVDLNTGIITFGVAPAGAVDVQLITEFDIPVRFDTDNLEVSVEIFDTGALPSIPLVEIKEGP